MILLLSLTQSFPPYLLLKNVYYAFTDFLFQIWFSCDLLTSTMIELRSDTVGLANPGLGQVESWIKCISKQCKKDHVLNDGSYCLIQKSKKNMSDIQKEVDVKCVTETKLKRNKRLSSFKIWTALEVDL